MEGNRAFWAANSIIHQNVAERNAELTIKTVIGKRIGYASTNQLDDRSICDALGKAVFSAWNSQDNADFVSLPSPQSTHPVDAFDVDTAFCAPPNKG